MEISVTELQAMIDAAVATALLPYKSQTTITGATYNTAGLLQPVDFTPSQPIMTVTNNPEDIIKPMSTFDELSEEELLYWSSSYYDELQAKKNHPKEEL